MTTPIEGTTPRGTRLILASEDLLDTFGTRTEDGRKITAEWGEPTPEGWYEPIFTTYEDDALASKAETRRLRAIEDAARAVVDTLTPVPAEAGRRGLLVAAGKGRAFEIAAADLEEALR